MSLQYKAKTDYRVYFVTVEFTKTIHCVPYGFTDALHRFALARTESEAIAITEDHYQGIEPKVRRVQVMMAREQDLKGYYFPESIIGIQQGADIN